MLKKEIKEKVFCKKCKYYNAEKRWNTYGRYGRNTTGKKIIGYGRTPDEPTQEGKEYPIYCDYDKNNKKNNCEYYEKKKSWFGG